VDIKAQCIRWLLARRKQNTTYQDITLRELAELVCERLGLVLEMEGDGATYKFLDQSGLSDFGLLKRECDATGCIIQDRTDNRLIITPMRPNFTGFVIQPWMVIEGSLSFSDEASGDMPANRKPSGGGAEVKAEIKPDTGEIVQVREEDSRGTKEQANEGEMMAVTGDAVPSIYGTIAVSNESAGLPTQETGAIALANNEEISAQALKEEVQRVQGYPGSVTLKMSEATLSIVPGNVIALSPDCAGGVFAREWRVAKVEHTVQAESVPTTALSFYTPQEAVPKKKDSEGGSSSTAQQGEQGASSASGYAPPHSNGATHLGDGIGPRRSGRMHRGFDFAAPQGTPCLAMKAGTVIDRINNCVVGDVECGGQFGNRVYLQHDDGVVTIYAHLSRVLVNLGDEVTQGQIVGEMGTTGFSTGNHSHIEFRKGDGRLSFSDVGLDVLSFAKGEKRAGFKY
jgi:murein DD-endopeptidase MepM/ murein hydrolase activator NlpD